MADEAIEADIDLMGPSSNTPLYSQPSDLAFTSTSSSSDSGRGLSPNAPDSSSNGEDHEESRPTGKRRRTGPSSSAATTPAASLEAFGSSHATHDISFVPYHAPDIATVTKQIAAATREAWNRRFSYSAVYALMLYWEEDDLNVAPEVASLEATFREIYRYSTQIWKIGSKKPGLELKERLITFLKENDAEGNLVIFYYGGHAKPNSQPGGAPLWTS